MRGSARRQPWRTYKHSLKSAKETVMAAATRIEKDSMGPIDVPADKLWGAQTQRSLEHFRISSEKMPEALIHALAQTKRAAACVNMDLGLSRPNVATPLL